VRLKSRRKAAVCFQKTRRLELLRLILVVWTAKDEIASCGTFRVDHIPLRCRGIATTWRRTGYQDGRPCFWPPSPISLHLLKSGVCQSPVAKNRCECISPAWDYCLVFPFPTRWLAQRTFRCLVSGPALRHPLVPPGPGEYFMSCSARGTESSSCRVGPTAV
jgi:hypothetical protein